MAARAGPGARGARLRAARWRDHPPLIVRDRAWIAYCWYLGGRRSRLEINVDLPVTAPDLIVTLGHEGYPGHHLEGAWKETDLVDGHRAGGVDDPDQHARGTGQRRAGPLWHPVRLPARRRAELLLELFDRAGLTVAADPAAAREIAERAVRLIVPRNPSMRDRRGRTSTARRWRRREDVLAYLRDVGRYPGEVAAKRLEFIDDPLSRLYVFAYDQGEELVARWVEHS